LLAAIFDQGIKYERAWQAPLELQRRLGHLDPSLIRSDLEGVRRAVAGPPALHRYVNHVPIWVVHAADRVMSDYGGDAAGIWNDRPTARELQRRLQRFDGIGQKTAAMTVQILERQLGVPIRRLEGGDIVFDIHVRRVFLRTGIARYDEQTHMGQTGSRAEPGTPWRARSASMVAGSRVVSRLGPALFGLPD
jgi:endonuclease III